MIETHRARLKREAAELAATPDKLAAAEARIAELEADLRKAGRIGAQNATRIAELETQLGEANKPKPKKAEADEPSDPKKRSSR